MAVREAMIPWRERLVDWAWRRRNLLLFLAVLSSVVGTVAYRWRWSRLQDLPRVAEIGRTEGLAALDAGKFDTAYQLLSDARRAVDALGDAVEGAADIRHGAEEAAIFVNLIPDRLETILDLANKPDPEAWSSRFDTFYKGRSILIEANITSAPDADGVGRYELDYRVFPDGEGRPSRIGRIDPTGLRLFELSKPNVGDHVLLGARLASLRLENEVWFFGLEPDSGVFITYTRALEALDWPGPDEFGEESPP